MREAIRARILQAPRPARVEHILVCRNSPRIAVEPSSSDDTLTVTLAPDLSVMDVMLDALETFLAGREVDGAGARRVMLAAEEIVVNAICHGGVPDHPAAIRLDVRREHNRIVTKIAYQGVAFDPTLPRETRPVSLDRPGGQGLQLVRNAVDDFLYQRDGKRNIVESSVAV